MKKALLIVFILIVSMVIAFVPTGVLASIPSASQVQTARGTSTTSPLSVTLGSTPTSGNVLIAVLGYKWGALSAEPTIAINQGDIVWYPIASSSNLKAKVSIYLAIVPDSGSKPATISISMTGATGLVAVADVCEYSGLNTAYILANGYDQAAVASDTGTILSTGNTPATAWPYELWVGGTILNANGAQSTPASGFTLLDGAVFNSAISVAYLEKMVSSTGVAQSGTTSAVSGTWAGVIVTLPLAPTITLSSGSGIVGATITITGDGYTADSDITATFDGAALALIGNSHTDANGHFEATFTVPLKGPATYTVTATDTPGYSASEQFSVVMTPVPESPIGVLAPIAAFALALVVWSRVKRSKNSTKQFLPF